MRTEKEIKDSIDRLAPCTLLRYSQKTGKIDTTLDARGYAMLNLWALQNTTKTKETVVFENATGQVIQIVTGSTDGFPDVTRFPDMNIEGMCPGILDAIKEVN